MIESSFENLAQFFQLLSRDKTKRLMKNFNRFFHIPIVAFFLLSFSGCDKNDNVVLFSIEDDKELGQQVSTEIENDPNFALMDRTEYTEAYGYLDAMVNEILNSGEVEYKDEFVWEVTLINNDSTLNAFATPGGYIYVYTGLIKYLDNADDLAGVLGHEIAHADLRHTSRNIQTHYTVSFLLEILLGENSNQISQIAAEIASGATYLKFSREYEEEADSQSVLYLSNTKYACNGAASFFEKLETTGQGSNIPEFLSTHPSTENRIEDINSKADEIGCDTTLGGEGYENFKQLLP